MSDNYQNQSSTSSSDSEPSDIGELESSAEPTDESFDVERFEATDSSQEILPSHGGIRFGLWSVIIATTICGIVFALIRWLGVWQGIAVSNGLALTALMLLLIVAIFARLIVGAEITRHPQMERMERVGFALILLTTILMVSLVVSGGMSGVAAIMNRRAEYASWHERLGFQHRSIDLVADGRLVTYLEVTAVEPGGKMEQAGIREGDVIGMPPQQFFRRLDNRRSEEFDVVVGRSGTSNYWKDYSTQNIVIPISPQ